MCTKIILEVSKYSHLGHRNINGRLIVLVLGGLKGMISMLILRSVESKQTCRENQPLYTRLHEPMWWIIPKGPLYALEKIFPQTAPQRSFVT